MKFNLTSSRNESNEITIRTKGKGKRKPVLCIKSNKDLAQFHYQHREFQKESVPYFVKERISELPQKVYSARNSTGS